MNARRLQRVADVVLVIVSLPISLPLIVLVTLWILFDDPGPVIHSQPRTGRDGKRFLMYKFRTLYAGSEDRATVAPDGDPRITRSGRTLRKWRLDELPQLFNILRGDMSVVGPRPERPEHLRRVAPELIKEVYRVRPGLTGPAAIAFLAEDAFLATAPDPEDLYCSVILPEKLRRERDYIERWSMLTDLRCILQTLVCLFSRRAYRRSYRMIEQLVSTAGGNGAGKA